MVLVTLELKDLGVICNAYVDEKAFKHVEEEFGNWYDSIDRYILGGPGVPNCHL